MLSLFFRINGDFFTINDQRIFCKINAPWERTVVRLEVVAINDLTSPKVLAYLLKHDSNYGPFPWSVDLNVLYDQIH
jgi:glyceraldehyde-3-phosphate dehydrogenase/erythrose-4-phosphate dehydrogenase